MAHEDEDGDEGDEYRQTTEYIQTILNKEFEETYKGFASFEFDTDAFDMEHHEDCITIRSL